MDSLPTAFITKHLLNEKYQLKNMRKLAYEILLSTFDREKSRYSANVFVKEVIAMNELLAWN